MGNGQSEEERKNLEAREKGMEEKIRRLEKERDMEKRKAEQREKERQAPKKLDKAWREDIKFDDKKFLEDLKQEVISYYPLKGNGAKKGEIACSNILLIGPMKAGKSTFINTMCSTFKGYVAMTVPTGERDRSLTKKLRKYTFDGNGKELKFKLIDSRGLENQYHPSNELGYILDGHMPDGYEFNKDIPFTEKSAGFKKNPQLHDKVHCVVYILDANQVSIDGELMYADAFLKELKAIQEVIDTKGIPQLLVMSKVDVVCQFTKEKLSDLLYSEHNYKRCRHLEKILAIPLHGILPSKSYTTEHSMDDNTSTLALYNVRQMLRACDDYLALQARKTGKCATQ